jgi:hypothetical protein
MLLQLVKKLRAEAKAAPSSDLPIGSLTVIEAYPQLRYGDVEGIGLVTIDATGNMVGFSPVERCQDKHGETAWIPTELIRNLRLTPFLANGEPAKGRKGTETTK